MAASRIDSDTPQSRLMEIFNSISHGLGIGLGIAALVLLVFFAAESGDGWRVVSFAIYGTTLILLYTASTLYHAARNPTLKGLLNLLDHSAIYLLIAGTYTPFALVTLRGGWGWCVLGIVWGLAIAGILYKIFFFGRYPLVDTGLYLAMGWLVVLVLGPLLSHLPALGIMWLFLGGLMYTAGVIFFAWPRLRFGHCIWHLFVLAGSICHFFCLFWHVLPLRA